MFGLALYVNDPGINHQNTSTLPLALRLCVKNIARRKRTPALQLNVLTQVVSRPGGETSAAPQQHVSVTASELSNMMTTGTQLTSVAHETTFSWLFGSSGNSTWLLFHPPILRHDAYVIYDRWVLHTTKLKFDKTYHLRHNNNISRLISSCFYW